LGLIGITSVIELFDLRDAVEEDKLISNWAILSLALVAPLYGLIHLPRIANIDTDDYQVNKFF
jgi:hypothetical protein